MKSGIRQHLRNGDLRALFVEDLGWDIHAGPALDVEDGGYAFRLEPLAAKRGMVAYRCHPIVGQDIPTLVVRRKVERRVREHAHEHLIVYVDASATSQLWQWVRREPGKPLAIREYPYSTSQSGELLAQKLEAISFGLSEEEHLTIAEVTGRVRQAFDIEKITKRFYERFKAEHAAFLTFVKGIQERGDCEWYASLMLNRLMFIYFIQKKGFLDQDPNYLRNRLQKMQARKGRDRFLSFYRYFLLRLFHEGLGQPQHTPQLDALLGTVPYLNGGLFDVHKLERDNPDIAIADEAFERIFDFFDSYQWHLDERPLRADNEINPDVLGYIFEKYVNQKQMGAYYTKEDITEYIAKSTVIPHLLDSARAECGEAFESGGVIWTLLRDDPDRYIYDAARHGTNKPLPAHIEEGRTDPTKRTAWNTPAPAEFALPTETWREHVIRRQRYEVLREKLALGEVTDFNQLVTHNLNVRQLAQDIVENSDPKLLQAIYRAIENITILDPTCGSGAFLFAALNVLEPLYEACLNRMESDRADAERIPAAGNAKPLAAFEQVLDKVSDHPNREYFILKSIILSNLFGVDIMEEAVEICKLRLFLKLVAQVDRGEDIEPLPDIDFNIRAGNTLVGFINYDDVQQAVLGGAQSRMDLGDNMKSIRERANSADRAFQRFRSMQTDTRSTGDFTDAKRELRKRLDDLSEELDRYLANEYGVSASVDDDFLRWKVTHQPFHWFVEFYGIITRGGFDVIVGNPPYVEYSKVRRQYTIRDVQTMEAGNLYAFIVERSLRLQRQGSRFGMILQLSAFCTPRMQSFQDMWFRTVGFSHLSFFDDRPGKLFDGLEHIRVAIAVGNLSSAETKVATTRYIKFATEERPVLFDSLSYQLNETPRHGSSVLKISSAEENSFASKLWAAPKTLAHYTQERENRNFVYYGYGYGYWGKILNFKSFFRGERVSASTGDKYLYCQPSVDRDVITAVMNSSLFYWFYVNYSDGHNFTKHVIGSFPFEYPSNATGKRLKTLCAALMKDLRKNARRKVAVYKATGQVEYDEFVQKLSKNIIDKIDTVLARHYKFSPEELDFIINYDIKYRMGRDNTQSK